MTRRGLVLFAIMAIIWGIPYLFIRVAVAEISPATLVFVRTSIGAAILLPIALFRVDLRPVLRRWRWLVAFAAVEIAGPWVLLGSAEQHITSSLAALMIAGTPLVGTIVALTTGGSDRLTSTRAAGLLLGIIGVVGIVGADFHASDATAIVEVVLVAIGYAVGPAILSRRLDGLPSIGVMALSLALTALIYAPIAAVQWPAAVPSTNALGAIATLGVVCTALAFILFGELIAEVGPVRATVITYINPAVAAVLGVLVLNETFTVPMAIGFAFVIAGSALATRRTPGAAAPTSAAPSAPGTAAQTVPVPVTVPVPDEG
jgi:drug/metabolite transporter (DMT)-like permease